MKRQSLRGKLSDQPDLHLMPAAAESALAPLLVRSAGEQDIVEMITLLAQAGRPMPTPAQVPAVAAIYREWLGQAGALMRVTERQGQVVGVLIASLRPRANWLTPELWISDLAAADGEGEEVGHDLLVEALAVAERWGCFRVACEPAGLAGLAPDALGGLGFVEHGPALTLELAPIPVIGTRGVRRADGAQDGVPISYRESSV